MFYVDDIVKTGTLLPKVIGPAANLVVDVKLTVAVVYCVRMLMVEAAGLMAVLYFEAVLVVFFSDGTKAQACLEADVASIIISQFFNH